MRRALGELGIDGVRTTIPFHRSVMDEPDFLAGNVSVRYLDLHPELTDSEIGWSVDAAVAVAAVLEHESRNRMARSSAVLVAQPQESGRSAWQRRFEVDE